MNFERGGIDSQNLHTRRCAYFLHVLCTDSYLADDAKADKIKKAIIQVKYDERNAGLLTDRRAAYGLAWIKHDDDGHEVEVDLNQVLVAVIEA